VLKATVPAASVARHSEQTIGYLKFLLRRDDAAIVTTVDVSGHDRPLPIFQIRNITLATLSIAEFDQLVITSNNVPPFGKLNPNTKYQTVAIGSSSTPSNPFATTTQFVRLAADADCSVIYSSPGRR
jgi:hypothetical protein